MCIHHFLFTINSLETNGVVPLEFLLVALDVTLSIGAEKETLRRIRKPM